MSTELRVATDHVRRIIRCVMQTVTNQHWECYGASIAKCIRDEVAAAQSQAVLDAVMTTEVLAEHPDDNDPVTKERLEAIGWGTVIQWPTIRVHGGNYLAWRGGEIRIGTTLLCFVKTMGDVRRLMVALGIQEVADSQPRQAVQHGVTCEKKPHTQRQSYLHSADDDTLYDVDGVIYCGRCHRAIDCDEVNPVDEDPHTECRREIETLRAKLSTIRGRLQMTIYADCFHDKPSALKAVLLGIRDLTNPES